MIAGIGNGLFMQAKVEAIRRLSWQGCSVWGVGFEGNKILERLLEYGITIQHVFDSLSSKIGQSIHEYIVENFDNITVDNIVVTTAKYYEEIKEQTGNRAVNVYSLDEYIWKIPE